MFLRNTVAARRKKFRPVAGLAAATVGGAALLGTLPGSAAAAAAGTGTAAQIVSIAEANVGAHSCDWNSANGKGFDGSCSGENWCGDFVAWVWQQAGVTVPATAPAWVPSWEDAPGYHTLGSGYTPLPGDAVVYGDNTYPNGAHIAVVTGYADGLLSDVGGNEGGDDGDAPSVKVDEGNGAAFNPHTTLFAGTPHAMWVLGYVSSGAAQGTPAPVNSFRVTSSIAAMRDGSSQVLAMSTDGTLWHNTLSPSGTWSGWTTVAGGNGTPFVAEYAAIAGIPDGSGSAQILAVGTDGTVYHNIRYANGTWQGFRPLTGGNGTAWKTSTAPSITGLPDGSAQILVTSTDGTLYHNTRTSSGWTGWTTIAGGNGTPFVTKGATIAGIPDGSGSSQVLAVGTDGTVYHNIRHANGTWQGFQPLTGGNGTAWKTSTTPSIAGLPNGSSQVVVTATDGTLYHNTRTSSGWTGWTTIAGGNGTPFVAQTDSLTALPDGSGTSEILAVGTNNVLYRNTRLSSGAWQGFQPLTGGNGLPWLTA
ncbi:CHAP domain-containing protein [Actinacidiphila epipremni]|uniref:CHAP domain-containing protein n=1 Tax=Actinacidiphila epipremni TaxID=2053013 RepID=A0ABX0ZJC1_9ACTN|nr:CHAP domain-containing protein [Actinacidiphila epipremni]NJP43202.1 CHAP domain-containing protein [Actinacidiphila epipremni]